MLVLNAEGRQAITSTLGIFDDPEVASTWPPLRAAASFADWTRERAISVSPGDDLDSLLSSTIPGWRPPRWLELARPWSNGPISTFVAAGHYCHLRSGAAVPGGTAWRPAWCSSRSVSPAAKPSRCYLALAGKTAQQIDPPCGGPSPTPKPPPSATVKAPMTPAPESWLSPVAFCLAFPRAADDARPGPWPRSPPGRRGYPWKDSSPASCPPARPSGNPRLLWAAVFVAIACHAVFARDFIYLPRRSPARARLVSGLGLAPGPGGNQPAGLHPQVLPLAGLTLVGVFPLPSPARCPGRQPGRPHLFRCLGRVLGSGRAAHGHRPRGFPTVSGPVNQPVFGFAFAALVMAWGIHVDLGRQRKAGEDARRRLTLLPGTPNRCGCRRGRNPHPATARGTGPGGERQPGQERLSRSSATNCARRSTPSLGYTQFPTPAGEARDKLAIVANNSEQLLRRINDVLDFSRGEAFSVEITLEPVVLLISSGTRKQPQLLARRRGNRFEASLGADCPPVVEADEARLLQVLQTSSTMPANTRKAASSA